MVGAKLYRNFEHYERNPKDLLLFPITILFGYFHGLIKIYALCTLSNVSITACFQKLILLIRKVTWGSRDVHVEANDSITANTSTSAVLSHKLQGHRPVVIETSESNLILDDGRILFDATSAVGVNCLGSKVERVRSATDRVPVSQALDREFSTEPAERLAKTLIETASGIFSKAYFCHSGQIVIPTQASSC